jgi:hypothetical protein
MNIIKEHIYKHGTGNISNFSNKPSYEPLGPSPIIILIMLFWNIKTLPVLVEVPQTIIPYFNSE